MKQKDLKEIHELLLENVREENEKEMKEISNSQLYLNPKRNLISAAREALKPKNLKQQKIKNNILPIKINRTFDKKKPKKITYKNDQPRYNILSDQQYLNFMLNDLNLISNSIKRQQNKFNPTYSNNFNFLTKINRKNKYNSFEQTKNKKIINLKKNNNLGKNNYNLVNLLTQIIGEQESNENKKNENEITENNNYFYNLCYDNNEQKIYVKDNNEDNYY